MAWNETERLKQRFQIICDVRWDDMMQTDTPGVRSCGRCDKAVFTASTEADFDHHANLGRCVFVQTTHGTALVAKPDGPPGPPGPPMPPRPPPLAGAPRMPEPPPPRIPVPPRPKSEDHSVDGRPVHSEEVALAWLL